MCKLKQGGRKREMRIGKVWGLWAVFMLAWMCAAQAQYTYTTNSADTNTVTITGYTGPGISLNIPSNINDKTVTCIGDSAFSENANLTSVTIPETVTSMEQRAFYGCSNLVGIFIPDNVTNIGRSTFEGCASLTNIAIPAGVATIGTSAFRFCDSLTEIAVDTNNSSYCSVAGCCSTMTETTLIQFPGGKAGGYAIPDGVATIGSSAFWGCSGLTNVTIPASVSAIGNTSFSSCEKPDRKSQVDSNNSSFCSLAGVCSTMPRPPSCGFPRARRVATPFLTALPLSKIPRLGDVSV